MIKLKANLGLIESQDKHLAMRFIAVLLFIVLFCGADSYISSKKRKEKERERREGLTDRSEGRGVDERLAPPGGVKEAMEILFDSATIRDVQALMNDPDFVRQMEQLKSNPQNADAVKSAKDLFLDEAKAASLFSQIARRDGERASLGLTDAQLGMTELKRAAKDPTILSETLEMLKDPSVVAEV